MENITHTISRLYKIIIRDAVDLELASSYIAQIVYKLIDIDCITTYHMSITNSAKAINVNL